MQNNIETILIAPADYEGFSRKYGILLSYIELKNHMPVGLAVVQFTNGECTVYNLYG